MSVIQLCYLPTSLNIFFQLPNLIKGQRTINFTQSVIIAQLMHFIIPWGASIAAVGHVCRITDNAVRSEQARTRRKPFIIRQQDAAADLPRCAVGINPVDLSRLAVERVFWATKGRFAEATYAGAEVSR